MILKVALRMVYCRGDIKSGIYSGKFTLDLHMVSSLFDMPFSGQITARMVASRRLNSLPTLLVNQGPFGYTIYFMYFLLRACQLGHSDLSLQDFF